MFYQSLVSLQVLGLYLLPPILFCQFSTVSSTDIFIFIPLRSYHHFVVSNPLHISRPETLIYEIVSLATTAIRHCCTVCASVCMTLIICARLFERVYLHAYVYSAAPRLHVTTHKFKRREEDEGEEKKEE